MQQQGHTPEDRGTGAGAGTPPFGAESAALLTAADHQIPARTSPAHPAAGATAGASRGAAGETPLSASAPAGTVPARAAEWEARVNQGMRHAADRLDEMAQRLERAAEERLGGATGPAARAGDLAHSAVDAIESVAGYLRDNDARRLRGDLERQVRRQPLPTLLVAVAAGWLAGKILR